LVLISQIDDIISGYANFFNWLNSFSKEHLLKLYFHSKQICENKIERIERKVERKMKKTIMNSMVY
jgi:hypothetical protein